MILKERPPRLRRGRSMADHVLRHRGLRDLDAQFQQLAVNAGCTPTRVVVAHRPNQIPNLLRQARPTRLATANLPRPKQTEALPMPGHNSLGFNDHQSRFPLAPDAPETHPEDSIG